MKRMLMGLGAALALLTPSAGAALETETPSAATQNSVGRVVEIRVSGGAGDDFIKIDRANTTVNFGKGDGHDVVKAHDQVTVAITG